MTADEARAALSAIDPKIRIEEQQRHMLYTDGVEAHRTEPFLYSITGSHDIADETGRSRRWAQSVRVYLSPPPGNGRVVAVERVQTGMPNAPTGAQYRDALIQKYGTPSFSQLGVNRWDFPSGKVQCLLKPSDFGQAGRSETVGAAMMRGLFVFKGQTMTDTLRSQKAKDLSECASFLEYKIGPDTTPVQMVSAHLVDVVGIAEAEIAANAWVAGLAAQARKARESKVKGPTL